MNDIWFTSDTHFGHVNIITFCNRPFSCVEEMDEAMIQHWNQNVKPNDTIWHLGDFSFHRNQEHTRTIFNRLNGVKCLVKGNHDHTPTTVLAWHDIVALTTINIGNMPITLCHYAMRVWDRSHRGSFHFYGHSHGTLAGDNQSLDVGVDCWDFYPTNLELIQDRLKMLPLRIKEF